MSHSNLNDPFGAVLSDPDFKARQARKAELANMNPIDRRAARMADHQAGGDSSAKAAAAAIFGLIPQGEEADPEAEPAAAEARDLAAALKFAANAQDPDFVDDGRPIYYKDGVPVYGDEDEMEDF